MNFFGTRGLRFALFTLLASLTLAFGLFRWSQASLAQARAAVTRLAAEKSLGAERLARADREKLTVARYADAYRLLQARGVIGDEPRGLWLEALTTAHARLGLFELDYRLSPREAVPSPVPLAEGLVLTRTRMELDFALLHEGELEGFFEHLRARNAGVFAVRDCELKRAELSDEGPTTGPRPGLRAQCRLDWYTLDLKGRSGVL